LSLQLFSNNAITTLAAPINASATSLSVISGAGSLFPAISGSNFFVATLLKINTGTSPPTVTAYEIIKVIARAGDTMTIVRGQENTTALSWNAGDTMSLDLTAGGYNQFVQPAQAQAQGYDFAFDTGTANAYVIALTPALAAHVQGMPIRVFVSNTNTGPSTLNDGAGSGALRLPGNIALSGDEVIGGAIITAVWTGSYFELIDGAYATPGSVTAAIATALTGVGQSVVEQLGGTSGIGSGYTAIVFDMPVVGGASYALTFDSDITTASVGNVASRIVVTTGSGAITTFGTGLCLTVNGAGGGGQLIWAQNNAAGTTGLSITNNATVHARYTGNFSVGAGVTSVTYELAVTIGTISVPAGGFVQLLRIN
jgi:hypothetical protein